MNGLNKESGTLSIVGLGKLGLPLAASFTESGLRVYGIDINKEIVNAINKSQAPFYETGLQKLIKKTKHNLVATSKHSVAINKSDTTIILVATPSNNAGNFSNRYLESALASLAGELKKTNKKYHLFIISSTVTPGSIKKRLIPLIEKESGRKLNKGFGISYVPDFVKLGSVIKNFTHPDILLIGEADTKAGEITEQLYKKIIKNEPAIHRTTITNAELAKVSLNCYLTLKISFANTIANISEKIPGANVDKITEILGSDKRISPKFFKGAMAFGGTCFPRDTKAFKALSRKYDYPAYLVEAIDNVNKLQNKHLLKLTIKQLKKKNSVRVAILGLAFKADTPVIEASPGIILVKNLLKRNYKIKAFDALATGYARKIFGNKIKLCKTITSCIKEVDVIVLTTPDDKFKDLHKIIDKNSKQIIIDGWRILNRKKLPNKLEYIAIGINQRYYKGENKL